MIYRASKFINCPVFVTEFECPKARRLQLREAATVDSQGSTLNEIGI
jgi:hypothetical protein